MSLPILFTFLLGACVGSFLNVVLFRMGKASVVHGRSHCMHCKHTLAPWELIPIFSYVLLAGRCRSCKKHIAIQYPLVEFFTGVGFTYLAFILMGSGDLFVPLFVYGAVCISLFVLIATYDLVHMIVPDIFVYPLAALAFVQVFFSPELSFVLPSWWAIVSGPLVAAPFGLLWIVSKGRWIGLGDAKIALPIGWFLGLSAGYTAVAIAFWTGAIVSIALLLVSRLRQRRGALTMKSEVPFAPFLAIGAILVYVTGINFFFVL